MNRTIRRIAAAAVLTSTIVLSGAAMAGSAEANNLYCRRVCT